MVNIDIDWLLYRLVMISIWYIDIIIDIDWLILVDSLISTYLTRWFDLFNHNQKEWKNCKKIWLVRAQALQILWDSVTHPTISVALGFHGSSKLNNSASFSVDKKTRAFSRCMSYKFSEATVVMRGMGFPR